jgi:hypothetical protein
VITKITIDKEAGVLTAAGPPPTKRGQNPGRRELAAEQWDRTSVSVTEAVRQGRPNRSDRRHAFAVNITRAQKDKVRAQPSLPAEEAAERLTEAGQAKRRRERKRAKRVRRARAS